MRSLIILEVEHGEDTDSLTRLTGALAANRHIYSNDVTVTNYTVRVDLPACFVLDSGVPDDECPRHGGPVGSDETCPCTPEEEVTY